MCKNTTVDITAQRTEDSVISSKNKKIDRQALLSMMSKYTYKFMNHTSPIILKYTLLILSKQRIINYKFI